ncbi:hypothetical protein ACFPAG_02520 [Vogesella sp. GCM10023246]|uniref:Integrase n=1 Tax=Vogesella oryzagri TaxID=3160864 RepID=A0ABV1M2B7_9NEIS
MAQSGGQKKQKAPIARGFLRVLTKFFRYAEGLGFVNGKAADASTWLERPGFAGSGDA